MVNFTYNANGIALESSYLSYAEANMLPPSLSAQGMFVFGNNAVGQLASGDTTSTSSPNIIGSAFNWTIVATGTSTGAAINTSGQIWAWGDNTSGALGQSDITTRSSPIQIGSLSNWSIVSGNDSKLSTRATFNAIKTDGTMWGWGYNGNGEIGDGSIVHRSSPVQVGTFTYWRIVTSSSSATHALTTAGTMYAWGGNTNGQLGDNTVVAKSSPIQIGTDSNWRSISAGNAHVAAIKRDDNRVYMWGYNSVGQLQSATTVHRSSPVQVAGTYTWRQVSCGQDNTAGTKLDNTLYTWGFGLYGQLGTGSTTNQSLFSQVGLLANWLYVAAGNHMAATKTDGTLWTWGQNTAGELGLSDTAHRSSPVQVGTSSKWKRPYVSSGSGYTIATANLY